jgi:6-phosphogluconate dehydrogenase
MQLIAEVYDILRRGLGAGNDELHEIFSSWNRSDLNSFLVEITSQVFLQRDDRGGSGRLLDQIKDVARQKGTGKWTSQDAFDLQVPVPTIDLAVTARDLSGMALERAEVAKALGTPIAVYAGDRPGFIAGLGQALNAATILTYAQGMDLLRNASKAYSYGIDLANVARIWRGGCIIRSGLLEDIRSAYTARPDLPSMLVEEGIAAKVRATHGALRVVIRTAVEMGVPVPCLMGSLSYLDSLRCGALPTNLTQGQRDFFGAHTYERTDVEGTFHSHWGEG